MDSPIWLPLAIVLGFFVVFPLFWSGIVLLIGQLSGWTSLGTQFRARTPVAGQQVTGMRVGWASYNNVARVEATPEGLGIDVFVLFRPGHPPLRLPWSEVRFDGRHQFLFLKQVHLRLGPQRVRLILPASSWDSIAAEARRGGVEER